MTWFLLALVLANATMLWSLLRYRTNLDRSLDELLAQFRTDHGTSLRDVVNRLETASELQRSLAKSMRTSVETLTDLTRLVQSEVAEAAATGMRIEKAAVGVAGDLADAQARADEVDVSEAPGTASDAASRG